MSFLNLGIVAHVDAGKTSLTERLLFDAGAIDALGRVDDGSTRTDSLDLERRRGITIRAAVTSFVVDDLTITLVDTPGHPDFIAEVERSLAVLDAAVLVISAVEGVQPQTVVIWRALQRLEVPTVLFVNKIDRAGADVERVHDQVRRRLTPHTVPLVSVQHTATRDASVTALSLASGAVVEALAEVDDRVLAAFVDDRPLRPHDLARSLRRQVRRAHVVPLVAGSALTGAGLSQLRDALVRLLPRAPEPNGPSSGIVFAVDRDERGRRTWIRLWDGTIRARDRLVLGERTAERVTEIAVSTPAGVDLAPHVSAGQIGVLRGLSRARIGDVLGQVPHRRAAAFPPATRQALVEPVDPHQRTALYAGLTELADEDPLIGLRLDETDGEAAVTLHGDVQQEVIAALLQERYDVKARFLPTSTVCIERVIGRGSSLDRIGARGNPYLATIGLRVEPVPAGQGVRFLPGVERGNLPRAFVEATEEGVHAGLQQGLSGWQVTDCLVTMTASGYYPRQSKPHQKFDKSISSVAADFRLLAPVVLRAALDEARTRVCRPIESYELDLPDDAIGPVVSLVGRLGGLRLASHASGGYTHLEGHLPSSAVSDLAVRLPDITGGEGVLVSRLDHYAPAPAPAPAHGRSGPDPHDRDTWFRDMPR